MSFQQKAHRDRHFAVIHIGDKNMRCKQCGKNFLTISNLKQHILNVHERRKTYECSICGKKFSKNFARNRQYSLKHKKKFNAIHLTFETNRVY